MFLLLLLQARRVAFFDHGLFLLQLREAFFVPGNLVGYLQRLRSGFAVGLLGQCHQGLNFVFKFRNRFHRVSMTDRCVLAGISARAN